jgi:hypothetical protein
METNKKILGKINTQRCSVTLIHPAALGTLPDTPNDPDALIIQPKLPSFHLSASLDA